jgi:hypothetical protein
MDAHAAERSPVERQIERRFRDGPRVECRGIVADHEGELVSAPDGRDLDPARTAGIAVLDDVAHELVDRLDEVCHRSLIAVGRRDVLPDERPDGGQLAERRIDLHGWRRRLGRHVEVGHVDPQAIGRASVARFS